MTSTPIVRPSPETSRTTGASASPGIRPAVADDLQQIEQLLVTSSLPTVGVAEALCGFLVAECAGTIVGVVGVEECCSYGLLRSAAVAPNWRSQGLGRQLVERAIAESESRGVKALYLLTTTAAQYFPSFGFRTIARDQVPASVRATAEFCNVCPASATVMALCLSDT